jgi:hypothetical protein
MTFRQSAASMLTGGEAHAAVGCRLSCSAIHLALTTCVLSTSLKRGSARSWLVFPLAILLAVPSLPVLASDSVMGRETLRGLKAIKIVVDRPGPDLEREGLTRDQLQSDIEEQLKKADIDVDSNANEFLGLGMISARLKSGLINEISVAFSLGVYQVVTLNRNKVIKTIAETWSGQGVQSSPPKLSAQISRDSVAKLVDQFIKAYLEVNPN